MAEQSTSMLQRVKDFRAQHRARLDAGEGTMLVSVEMLELLIRSYVMDYVIPPAAVARMQERQRREKQ